MVSCPLLVFVQKIILLLIKYTKIVASRAALFRSDINLIVQQLRLLPRSHSGSLQRSQDPIAVFRRGGYSRGRKGGNERGERKGKEGESEGRKRKEEEGRLLR